MLRHSFEVRIFGANLAAPSAPSTAAPRPGSSAASRASPSAEGLGKARRRHGSRVYARLVLGKDGGAR